MCTLKGTPRERGFQYGYLLAKEIAQGIKATRTDWEYESATKWSWLLEKASTMFARKIDKENLAELDGIVEGMQAAGVPSSRAEIIAYNGYFELDWYWWPEELKKIKEGKVKMARQSCSAFIATGSMTADGGVVLGHNTMHGYCDVLPNVIIDIVPEKGHRILMQTIPGWIHSGTDFFITDAGLVGAETTIDRFERLRSKRCPGVLPDAPRHPGCQLDRGVVRHHEARQQRRLCQRLAAGRREHRRNRAARTWTEIRRVREEARRLLCRLQRCRGFEDPEV